MNRRKFVQQSALTTAVLATLSDPMRIWAAGGTARPNATTAAGKAMLQKYARAVDQMKNQIPASDPRNWTRQAQIHNDHCPHGNWWFLPWHRAYLYYFEQICQNVLNDTSFRIPYWNWSQNSKIPDEFLNSSSPLYDNTRASTMVSPEAVSQLLINRIVSSRQWLDLFSGITFTDNQRERSVQGILEATPHNTVHRNIGGNNGHMVTLMSPLDPIFWLHHCNIDRLWASWQRISGNVGPDTTLWKNHNLTVFYDPVARQQASPNTESTKGGKFLIDYDAYESGSGIRLLAPALQNFAILGAAPRAVPHVTRITGQATAPAIALGSGKNIAVSLSGDLKPMMKKRTQLLAASNVESYEAYLEIEDIPFPPPEIGSLRVFLNVASPSAHTSITDPGYVGTVSFFGKPHEGMPEMSQVSFSLNISQKLQEIAGSNGQQVQVGIVPVDLLNLERVSQATVHPARVRIVAVQAQ